MLSIAMISVGITCCGGAAHAQSSHVRLQQMVAQLQKAPDDNVLREQIARLAAVMRPHPVVPESARKHFVIAVTLQKEARTSGDYDLPIQEYRKALLIAPWWSDAYYNLATALELKQQYPEAIQDLKLSVLADPHGRGARAAQDKIYAVEAEQEKQSSAQAAEQAAKARLDAVYAGLDGGVWEAVLSVSRYGPYNSSDPSLDLHSFLEIHGNQIISYHVFNPNSPNGRLNGWDSAHARLQA